MARLFPNSVKISFDLAEGFPLLTTKKVFFNGVIRELLWFIKGDTNARHLEAHNVTIWSGNTSKEFLEKNGLPYEEGIGGTFLISLCEIKNCIHYKFAKRIYKDLFMATNGADLDKNTPTKTSMDNS